jgi:hypothetical protein
VHCAGRRNESCWDLAAGGSREAKCRLSFRWLHVEGADALSFDDSYPDFSSEQKRVSFAIQ